jgi:hypothetical protein
MIIKSKVGFIAAAALAGVASLAFSQTAATAAHHHHYVHRHVYTSTDAGYRTNAAIVPVSNATDNPSTTGGGSEGYNECAGHPRC